MFKRSIIFMFSVFICISWGISLFAMEGSPSACYSDFESDRWLSDGSSPDGDLVFRPQSDPSRCVTRLFDIARGGNMAAFRQFLAQPGFHINIVDKYGDSALHLAIRANCKRAVRFLCNNGISVFAQNNDKVDALNLAESLFYYDLLCTLVFAGGGSVPRIFSAICESRFDCLPETDDEWVENVNRKLQWTEITPIVLACQMGNVAMVKTLLFHGATYKFFDLLRLAIRFDRYSVVHFLLKAHPLMLREAKFDGNHPLVVALQDHSDAVFQLLCEYLSFSNVKIDDAASKFLLAAGVSEDTLRFIKRGA